MNVDAIYHNIGALQVEKRNITNRIEYENKAISLLVMEKEQLLADRSEIMKSTAQIRNENTKIDEEQEFYFEQISAAQKSSSLLKDKLNELVVANDTLKKELADKTYELEDNYQICVRKLETQLEVCTKLVAINE